MPRRPSRHHRRAATRSHRRAPTRVPRRPAAAPARRCRRRGRAPSAPRCAAPALGAAAADRRSSSELRRPRALLRDDFDVPALAARATPAAGAAALSVLTEPRLLPGRARVPDGGARGPSGLPLLRKDFVVDPYQLDEAVRLGADAVLLIVALLPLERLRRADPRRRTRRGLDALVEVHTEDELDVAARRRGGPHRRQQPRPHDLHRRSVARPCACGRASPPASSSSPRAASRRPRDVRALARRRRRRRSWSASRSCARPTSARRWRAWPPRPRREPGGDRGQDLRRHAPRRRPRRRSRPAPTRSASCSPTGSRRFVAPWDAAALVAAVRAAAGPRSVPRRRGARHARRGGRAARDRGARPRRRAVPRRRATAAELRRALAAFDEAGAPRVRPRPGDDAGVGRAARARPGEPGRRPRRCPARRCCSTPGPRTPPAAPAARSSGRWPRRSRAAVGSCSPAG